jgi:glycosyltransferase involved in cell wall biosynthesis
LTIRVSTIVPAYNSATTIVQAIESALTQDFDGHEVIVVDDGSTDDTVAALAGYGDRIRVIHQANAGAATARNAGAAIARGEYLSFLDADDLWLPNTLVVRYEALGSNPEAVLAYGDFSVVDDARAPLLSSVFHADPRAAKAPTMNELIQRTWPILPSAVMVRCAAFRSVGGFDQGFKKAGWEDFHLWMLLRERGPFVAVARLFAIHVDHPELAPEKYLSGRRHFIDLVCARYGRRAADLCRQIDRDLSAKFLERGVGRLRSGRFVASARDLVSAVRYSPIYVVRNLKPGRRLRKIAMRNGRS